MEGVIDTARGLAEFEFKYNPEDWAAEIHKKLSRADQNKAESFGYEFRVLFFERVPRRIWNNVSEDEDEDEYYFYDNVLEKVEDVYEKQYGKLMW